MGFIKSIVSRFDKGTQQLVDNGNVEYPLKSIETAEQAAEIVEAGIEAGNFAAMNQKLEELINTNVSQFKYVFDHTRTKLIYITLISTGVLSAGFLYFAYIGLGTFLFSSALKSIGLLTLLISAFILIANFVIIRRNVYRLRFYNRYEKYQSLIKYRRIVGIDNLATYSKVDVNVVIYDLTRAIKEKLIPQGHFGKDNLFFMVSDEVYANYLSDQALYDRYFSERLKEKEKKAERTDEIQQILIQGHEYVDKIHACNDIIRDKRVSQKLDRMEKVVSMIFHEIDVNPDNSEKMGLLLDYYLPTTEKLLNVYIDSNSKGIRGANLNKIKMEIDDSLDMINSAFENILNRFYQEQELDIFTDISAMEAKIKMDGLDG